MNTTVSPLPTFPGAVSALPGAASTLPGAEPGAEGTSSIAGVPLKATELNAKPSANFAAKLAATEDLLRQAATTFTVADGTAQVVQANSLGAEDVVVSHIIRRLGLNIPAFVLETGALHPETLALLERSIQATSEAIRVYKPQAEAVVQFVERNGAEAMYRSIELRKACCNVRKMEPLARALAGQRAWITGLRREQSGARADVPATETERAGDVERTKFNPLADWTWGDVWHYIATQNVDHNPLHDQFFPSIGCAPCTRAISLGEDFRAGRWWWEDQLPGGSAKECGLHVKKTTEGAAT